MQFKTSRHAQVLHQMKCVLKSMRHSQGGPRVQSGRCHISSCCKCCNMGVGKPAKCPPDATQVHGHGLNLPGVQVLLHIRPQPKLPPKVPWVRCPENADGRRNYLTYKFKIITCYLKYCRSHLINMYFHIVISFTKIIYSIKVYLISKTSNNLSIHLIMLIIYIHTIISFFRGDSKIIAPRTEVDSLLVREENLVFAEVVNCHLFLFLLHLHLFL